MLTLLQRSLSVLLCTLLFNFVSFAQEKETPKTSIPAPVEQPKANPTAKEQKPSTPVVDKKDDGGADAGDGKDGDPKDPDPKDKPNTSNVSGGQAAGTSPTASPEAAFMSRVLDIPVNTFTGTASVPIPIYTLREGNISVPVALYYNASGIKVHEVAGWAGINFQLLAGATINRISRGTPDEGKFDYNGGYGNNDSHTRLGFYRDGLKSGNDSENDSEPDLFLLNINGSTYKFTFANELLYDATTNEYYRKAVFFPDADIDIRVRRVSYREYGETNINAGVGHFVDWKVTMPDGMIYTFEGSIDAVESTFEIEAKTAQTQGVHLFGSELERYQKNNQVTSAWYVTQITSPFGNHIDFNYSLNRYAFYKINDQQIQTNNCTFDPIYDRLTVNKVYVQSGTLRSINSQKVSVLFNKDTFTCVVNPDAGEPDQPDSLCTPNSSNAEYRDDVDTWLSIPRNASTTGWGRASKKLNSITVIDKSNSSKSLTWTFEYDNKISDYYGQEPLPFSYALSHVGETHHYRLMLKKINYPDGNFHRLAYKTSLLPSRFGAGIDHWGFFNNQGNFHFIGKDYTRPCFPSAGNVALANRQVNTFVNYSQAYSLDSLISSTGNAISFTYDYHEAYNFTEKIGGNRIRKVESLDLISGLKTIKTYDYLQIDGSTSSGFMALKPLYHFTDNSNNEQWNSGLYTQLLGQLGKPAVGYSRVIEKTISATNASNTLGSTITDYSQVLTEIDLILPIGGTVTQSYTVRPWQNHFFQDYANGVPTSVISYNSSGLPITEKISSYSYGISDNTAINGYKSFRLNGLNYNFEEQYTEGLSKYRLKSETVKAYSQDGTNPIENTSTFTYKDEMPTAYKTAYPGKHNQVVKTESIDSYGYTNETFNKYASDYAFGIDSVYECQIFVGGECDTYGYTRFPHIPTDIEAKGIWQLQQKKMGATVVETMAKKNNKIVSATYQNFYDTTTSDHQKGLGKESYMAENLPLTTFIDANYNRTTSSESFIKDVNYDLKSTVEKYNPLGMPAVIQNRFGSRDSTVYDATNTLIIEQHNNIGAYDKNRVKMEYDNVIFGISKEVATNDLEVRKEYYDDGKIKQTKDKDGNILKHYQYYYRGQEDSDPHVSTGNTHNRIITRVPRVATTDALSLDYEQCMISVSYMDGSGRTSQNVAYKASPNQKDMISGVTFYDEFSRPIQNILPVESANSNGGYTADATVLSRAKTFYNDDAPYSEIAEYENSPLSRALKTYGVGKAWRDNLKYSEVKYETATGIKKFTVLHNSTTVTVGTYSDYVLTKKTLIDERGSSVIEYTDKAGNVVQKDVQVDDTNYLTTCYIFDDIGRHRYTLNPKAYNLLSGLTSFDETHTTFEPNVYAYSYDGRNRVYRKHSPSLGWNTLIYNRLNQNVLLQDSDEAISNTWNFVQKDGQGRTVKTGQIQLPEGYNHSFLQQIFDNFTVNKQFEQRLAIGTSGEVLGYDNNSFPNILRSYITVANLKTLTYFDDYDWRTNNATSGQITDYNFQANPYNTSAYSATNAKGLATGGFTKIEIFGDFLFPVVTYFDNKNRTIQSTNYQNLLARNQSDIEYNFTGETLKSQMIYRKQGVSDHVRIIEQSLDHAGRRTELFYSLKQGTVEKVPRLRMSTYSYDNIGRLSRKQINLLSGFSDATVNSQQSGDWYNPSTWDDNSLPTISDDVIINTGHTIRVLTGEHALAKTLTNFGTLDLKTGSFLDFGTSGNVAIKDKPQDPPIPNIVFNYLQDISYTYNVRGQMRGVNLDASENLINTTKKLFSYKLDYHEDNRYFDGSISKQTWKNYPLTVGGVSDSRMYSFTYDRANRLNLADFTGVGNENYDVSQDYDENGNIQSLQRYSKTGTNIWGLIDNLSYNYFNNGDQLSSVGDVGTMDGFKNGTNTNDDYEYYPDGKLKKDANREISLIEYNFLDLVSKISRGNGDYIEYKYTSTGIKRQTKRHIGGNDSYTLFDGEMIYQYSGTDPSLNNFTIAEIQNEEGRFVNNRLEYAYTDHLGNLRLSYRDSLGVAVIVQSGAYDCWGLEIRPLRYLVSGATQDKYTWQGKEDLTDDGLEGWSDFGWRIEDRTIGRWFTPDPAEQFESISTYCYVGDNPISHMDPDGRLFGIDDLIAGVVGGILNVAFNAGNVNNLGQALGYLGTGFISGVVATHPEFGGPLLAGAILGAGNTAIQGGNLGQIALGGAVGAATSWAGGTLNSSIAPLVSKMAQNVGSPIIRNSIQQAIGGAITGGAIGGFFKGTMNSLNGGNFLEGFGEGLAQGVTAGVVGGVVGGVFKGVNEAKALGVNPYTGKMYGVRSYDPDVTPSSVILTKGSMEGIERMKIKGKPFGFSNSLSQLDVKNHTQEEVWNFLSDPRSNGTFMNNGNTYQNPYLKMTQYTSHDGYRSISFSNPGDKNPYLKLRWTNK